jgi:sulfate permease, SulP family
MMKIFHGLNFNHLKGDVYGGLTAAVVALPLAMAMGVASGVGAIAGMYGAIFVGLFAALFGGTPAQVSGPTGPMTVVMAAIFTQYTAMYPDNPAYGAALSFAVVILGGFFQVCFGLLKFGKFVELVPLPVVSGFMSGIGIIIILLQLGPAVGQPSISRPLDAALEFPQQLMQAQTPALILVALVLILVYSIPRYFPALNRLIPSPLFALIAGTLSYLIFFEPGSTPIIGDIPTGFPHLQTPAFELSLALDMVASGLTLAALGSIDSLLTSLVADNITRTQHLPDRELIGQGIGNMVAGLFGGLPGAGATMRTVVNVNAGGVTPISGVLHALALLAVVLGAGSLASHIPKAVLAGILFKVGTDIIDWDYLKRIRQAPLAGIVIMTTVLVMTVAIDLLLAVGTGMVMTSFLFMYRMQQMQIQGISTISTGNNLHHLSEEEAQIIEQTGGRIMLFHLSGAMSFSSAKSIVRQHAASNNYDIMLLDLSEVPAVDYTTTRALEDILLNTIKSGRRIFLIGMRDSVRRYLHRQGVTSLFKPGKIYDKRLNALLHAQKLLEEMDALKAAE